jgi:hypothetical protein
MTSTLPSFEYWTLDEYHAWLREKMGMGAEVVNFYTDPGVRASYPAKAATPLETRAIKRRLREWLAGERAAPTTTKDPA